MNEFLKSRALFQNNGLVPLGSDGDDGDVGFDQFGDPIQIVPGRSGQGLIIVNL